MAIVTDNLEYRLQTVNYVYLTNNKIINIKKKFYCTGIPSTLADNDDNPFQDKISSKAPASSSSSLPPPPL